MNEKVIVISNQKNWLEQTARDQLVAVSHLPGVMRAVGLPDLHAGRLPIGLALLTEGRFYPHLIGNDIGCGMGLFETGVKLKKYKSSRWASKLSDSIGLSALAIENPNLQDGPMKAIGTIGAGNHFAEFQCVEQVYNKQLFTDLAISKEEVYLLVHSGSRDYGQQIVNGYPGTEGLLEGSLAANSYWNEHGQALMWAEQNRVLIARRLMNYLGSGNDVKAVLDCSHNYLEKHSQGWLHRKGAVSTKQGVVVIPGSRGTLTYLCMPKADTVLSLDSLSHGAGRKWPRNLCKSRLDSKYNKESIRTTVWKSQVICHDRNLLFEEAPEAYKKIEEVIASLLDYGLMEVVATLRPLLTFKG